MSDKNSEGKTLHNLAWTLIILFFTLCAAFLVLEVVCRMGYLDFDFLRKSAEVDPKVPFMPYFVDGKPLRSNGSIVRHYSVFRPNTLIQPGPIAGPVQAKINSFGFRDYEYPVQKPQGAFRIIIFGDSFTFGYGLKLEDSYPKQLEQALRLRYPGKQIEVLNLGNIASNTHTQSLVMRKWITVFKPDLVLVGFCLNDADYEFSSEENYCRNAYGEKARMSQIPPALYSFRALPLLAHGAAHFKAILDYGSILTEWQTYVFNLYQENNPGLWCMREGLERIAAISSELKQAVYFFILPFMDSKYKFIEDKIIKNISAYHLNIIYDELNSFGRYAKQYGQEEVFNPLPDRHYNKLGNGLLTEILRTWIEQHYGDKLSHSS